MSDFARGFVATLVGTSAEAEAAVELAGGRIGARFAWGAGLTGDGTVIVVEAEGVDDVTLAAALPGIAAVAEARDLSVVATIDASQIDRVAAYLFGPRIVLLCAPTLAERVAALAIAGDPGLPGTVREDDAERLRRLNEEVARIAAMLARLTEPAAAPTSSVDDRRRAYAAQPPREMPVDAAEIRRTIRARRARAQHFDSRLVEDPGWDMLLDLFAAELEGVQVSVSSLCIAAAVAPTTALRWISRMVEAGLFARVADAGDRRRAFLTLTGAASAALRDYVGTVRRAGLPIV